MVKKISFTMYTKTFITHNFFFQNIDLKKITNFSFEVFQQKKENVLTRFHRQYVNLNKSVPLYTTTTTTTFYQNQMKYDKEALEDYFCLLHIHKAYWAGLAFMLTQCVYNRKMSKFIHTGSKIYPRGFLTNPSLLQLPTWFFMAPKY